MTEYKIDLMPALRRLTMKEEKVEKYSLVRGNAPARSTWIPELKKKLAKMGL